MKSPVVSPSILYCIHLSSCYVHYFIAMLGRVSPAFRIREPLIWGTGVHLLYSSCYPFYEAGECKEPLTSLLRLLDHFYSLSSPIKSILTHYPDPPGLSVWTYIEATILTSHDENHRGPAFACACLAILFVLLPCVIFEYRDGKNKTVLSEPCFYVSQRDIETIN